MTRILSLFVVFMLTGALAFSQSRVVTGTVTDEKGKPVEGATIKIVGARGATASDANGFFRLANVAPNATLRVTSIEIKALEIKTADLLVVNIKASRSAANTELGVVTVSTTLGQKRQMVKYQE
jgi:TonB-dependent starch-binding outer membrane protein SusC